MQPLIVILIAYVYLCNCTVEFKDLTHHDENNVGMSEIPEKDLISISSSISSTFSGKVGAADSILTSPSISSIKAPCEFISPLLGPQIPQNNNLESKKRLRRMELGGVPMSDERMVKFEMGYSTPTKRPVSRNLNPMRKVTGRPMNIHFGIMQAARFLDFENQ